MNHGATSSGFCWAALTNSRRPNSDNELALAAQLLGDPSDTPPRRLQPQHRSDLVRRLYLAADAPPLSPLFDIGDSSARRPDQLE